MEYRRLGKAGLQVSALSLGSWVTFGDQISDDVAADLMKTAYDAGVNFFDNAEGYARGKSELVMGKILKNAGWSRDTFVVSSKVFFGGDLPNQSGLSRKHVFEACHAALRRLQVEYLDLYFCHRPDPNTPIEETVRAMTDLVRQGKVFYWGTSEWTAEQLIEAYRLARELYLEPPTMEQPQYSLLVRGRFELEYAPLCEKYGLGTTIWSPLASGLLTGKHLQGIQKETRVTAKDLGWLQEKAESKKTGEQIRQFVELAGEIGLSPAILAIAWCLKNPHVSTVILGASKVPQLQENLQAIPAQEKLTPEVMKRIDGIMVPAGSWD
jgi:voltage-dependent potassium channel beta subunit